MENVKQRAWRAWASAGLLAFLCTVLAVLQSRWISEVSIAERDRLREQLQSGLDQLSADLNNRVAEACAALTPDSSILDQGTSQAVYANLYRRFKESHERLFRRVALVIPNDDSLSLYMLDLDTAQFQSISWPAEWARLQETLYSRAIDEPSAPPDSHDTAIIELPRLGPAVDEFGGPGIQEQEWLILELNLDYFRNDVIPSLLYRYLGKDYDAEIVVADDPSYVIYHSLSENQRLRADTVDASVGLLLATYSVGAHGLRHAVDEHAAVIPPGSISGSAAPTGLPRWKLMVRHRTGSVEQIVARLRLRNIALSGGILLLILATVIWLFRISRQAQRLAELQMNFVAGVSHELRTPLTVIRTAAFNLRGKIASRPEQVERYGQLIQDESEKLAVLVDQILRYGNSRTGRVIREREPVSMEQLIEDGLRGSRVAANADLIIDKRLAPGLPLILADEQALKHAFRNLIDNAVKYGTEGSNWIGVFACTVEDEQGLVVELRVSDRGPGIPLEEQPHIFDPFFRGRRAVQDQIHGTGLGLNLVKKIVEAHGGTVTVKSEPMKGTEFIVRIPAAPPELQDEFAHSIN